MEEEGVLRFCFSHLLCLWLVCSQLVARAGAHHRQPEQARRPPTADGVMLADVELPEVHPLSTVVHLYTVDVFLTLIIPLKRFVVESGEQPSFWV